MSFVYSLCSSSRGNSTYVGNRDSGILVDAGLSLRAFSKHLAFNDIELSAVKGIFITHEHSDHVSGLKTIATKLNVPIYGSARTLEYLMSRDIIPIGCDAVEINKNAVNIAGFEVSSFGTPHDSADSVSYKMTFASGKRAVICTDLGHVTDEVYKNCEHSDFVLLESNYDENLLTTGSYPFFLKQRIRSAVGHLSNSNCAQTLVRLIDSGTTKFMLGHLSEQNNRPELAYASSMLALLIAGAEIDRDYILSVAKRQSLGELVMLD